MVEPHDNGLPALKDRPDDGVGETTGLEVDKGKFRAASLKNITVSGPYMHDGRFATLEEVIDHYSHGIAGKPNLAPELRSTDGKPLRFDFSQTDKAALIAFLETLTDENLLTDPRYGDPFRPK
jgi:cytochrome c peroxidase